MNRNLRKLINTVRPVRPVLADHSQSTKREEINMLTGTKSLLKSRGVWGGAVALLAGVAQLLGYAVTPADAAETASLIAGLVTSVAGLLALVGRIKATKKVG